jgi:hypothetical protein
MLTLARNKRDDTRLNRAGLHRPGQDIFRPCAAFTRWRRHADTRISTAADTLTRRWCAGCSEATP